MKIYGILVTLFNLSLLTSAQTEVNSTCNIGAVKYFCNNYDSLNIPSNTRAKECRYRFLTCKQIARKNHLTCVHIKFSSQTDSTFLLESKFENISLKRKVDGKVIHPFAILSYTAQYISPNGSETLFIGFITKSFKAKEYIVSYKLNLQYDLVLLFRGAEPGDKIVIDNFIDVDID
jgi:hypothetical protein